MLPNQSCHQCGVFGRQRGVRLVLRTLMDFCKWISVDGHLVLWLQNDARYVQVLCVLQRFINPGLQHFGAHLNLAVFTLESGTFWLDFSFVCCFSNWASLSLLAASSTVCLGRAKLEWSSTRCSAILTVHSLSHLLVAHRNV